MNISANFTEKTFVQCKIVYREGRREDGLQSELAGSCGIIALINRTGGTYGSAREKAIVATVDINGLCVCEREREEGGASAPR